MSLHPNWDLSCVDQLMWGRLLLWIFVALLIQPEMGDLRLDPLGCVLAWLGDSAPWWKCAFLGWGGGFSPRRSQHAVCLSKCLFSNSKTSLWMWCCFSGDLIAYKQTVKNRVVLHKTCLWSETIRNTIITKQNLKIAQS